MLDHPQFPPSEPAAAEVDDQVVLAAIGSIPSVNVVVVDTDLRYRAVLGGAPRLHGYEPESLRGRRVVDVVEPAVMARIAPHFERALGGETVVDVAESDDGLGVYETTYGPAVENGRVVGAVAVVRDVTVEHRAVAELAESIETFELSFAAAPIGKALVGPDGRFIKVNDALCVLVGRARPELLQATFQEITHPDDVAADVDLLRETAEGRRDGYRLEKRYVRPDGTVVWALLAVSVVRDDAGRPRFYIAQVEDTTERKHALEEMERLATTDALTGLPNRLLLMDRLRHALAQARRGGWLVGVIFIDLDRFKPVNDSLGHDAGDELLRQAAGRLERAARDGDTTTRLGGDEFVVVCEQVTDVGDVTRIAERLREELTSPFTVYGHELEMTASIGVTVGNTASAESLLREADRSMYAAKRRRPNRIDVYSEALEVVAHKQLDLHAALRDGIARDELRVHFQPIVDLRTGAVVAREALVRWAHPTLGMLSPSAFLDGTDRSTLGVLLGERVLHQACSAAVSWPGDLAVHVNVSARHLAQPGFVAHVRRCLRTTGLAPDRLVLEITESLVLAASSSTLGAARALTTLGVGLSLDDFGTGFSSIAALNQLPIDSFKIDRSFVTDAADNPTSAALVEGLIGLGSHMDLDVIAEGIESRQQAEWLASRGCPHGQGFYFGRPVPDPT